MCGICGVRSFAEPPEVAPLRGMIAALAHRGPDGSGYFRDSEVALGHARLAIIDAAGGTQPMANEDGSIWVTFNGEIFNYVELASQLRARGHRFRTRSDTEVVVHAWEEWGLDCFSRFNGQWAVAIWDRRTRELALARDPFGILPLYYTRAGDRVLFASEVTSLFADPGVARGFDAEGIDETLTFWSTVAPRTPFAGISQVRPGECLIFDETGATSCTMRTVPLAHEAGRLDGDIAGSAAALREALIDATRLRFLRSDVPVAAYVSGGIDSTVTAGVIARHTDAELHTYSLRFADAEFDEGPYQELASARWGTVHHEVTVSGADIAGIFPAVVRHAEAPLLRAGPAPMYLLAQAVRAGGHEVVVTGEGADEVLGGYDIFREAAVRRFWARQPSSATRERAVELLYPWMHRSPNSAPAFARSFFGRNLDPADPLLSHRPRWDSTSALKGMLAPAMRDAASGTAIERLVETSPFRLDADDHDPLARAQWLEIATLLPGYILSSQGDRMLMANSIEGRFPFLDPGVTEVAATIPARHKLLGLDEKHVLKHAFADLVPAEILRRPKQPYRSPDGASFFGSGVAAWVGEVVDPDAVRAAGVFDPDIVRRLVEKFARAGARPAGNADNMRILAVLSTQLLYRDMIVGGHADQGDPPQPMVVFDELDRAGDR